MARAKRIYILIIKVNNLFSFFSSRCFLKEIENLYSVFLSSYGNTRESLGEFKKTVEKAVETLACGSCSHSISRSPKLPRVNTVHVFYFLKTSSNQRLWECVRRRNLNTCRYLKWFTCVTFNLSLLLKSKSFHQQLGFYRRYSVTKSKKKHLTSWSRISFSLVSKCFSLLTFCGVWN